MSDRLALAHASEDSGMSRDKAEHVATTVYDAIRGEVARKADLLELDTSARHRISITLRRAASRSGIAAAACSLDRLRRL